MKVKVKLFVVQEPTESNDGFPPVYECELEFPDDKFELLDEEETSAAVDTNVRTWAEQRLLIDWEVLKS
jgi:hypothetical protein